MEVLEKQDVAYPAIKNGRKTSPSGFKLRQKKNTIIIGWNKESVRLYDKILDYPPLNYDVKGFLSVKECEGRTKYRNVYLLGDLRSFNKWIEHLEIEEVLICIESEYRDRLDEITALCNEIGVRYKVISDVFDTVYGNAIKDTYESLFHRPSFSFRRMIDFFGSIFLMILLLPVFLVIVAAIKLESKGPVLYSQIRTGLKEKPFRIYKFRSMVQDAEKLSGPTWAQKNDPRITKVGRFMRLSRIDELPQLINIMRGDMSFIGPRPERPFFVESFKEQIPLYVNRLKIKPGVTGWAQVKWGYDESIEDVKEKLRYDLYYINHRSFWMDIAILFLTVGMVFTRKGQ